MVYDCLKAHRLKVFWDLRVIEEGKPLVEELRSVLRQSRMALFFLNEAAGLSSWVQFELEIARRHLTPVRAVLLNGQPPNHLPFRAGELLVPVPGREGESFALAICERVRTLLQSNSSLHRS